MYKPKHRQPGSTEMCNSYQALPTMGLKVGVHSTPVGESLAIRLMRLTMLCTCAGMGGD